MLDILLSFCSCGLLMPPVQITLEQIDLIKRLIEQYQQNLQFVTTAEGEP